ncbi:MAG: IS30 family transposase [Paraglaciecola sp.]|jgi:IS30 family transposase
MPNPMDMSERPSSVDNKQEVGHWEADTVYGQDGYLVTLVERVSKLLLTCRVKNKTKQAVTEAINGLLKPFMSHCLSITFDNGGKFAGHEAIKKALKYDTYFARPYHSWERRLNENTNGLLWCFFPKGMAIAGVPEIEIEQAQFMINIRLRKILIYLSPYEFITGKGVTLIAGI